MHGEPIRRLLRIALEQTHQVGARHVVRAATPERVTELVTSRATLRRLRERLEALGFDQVDEIADRLVTPPRSELFLDLLELVAQALRAERLRRRETLGEERLLVRGERGAARVERTRWRGLGGLRGVARGRGRGGGIRCRARRGRAAG